MKRFIILFVMLLFCGAVFAKTATVNNRFEFTDALIDPSVNSIIIKTSSEPKWVNYDYDIDRNLSISGSKNPLSSDDSLSSTLYMFLYRGINLTSNNLSLKNLAVANYDGDTIYFEKSPLFTVGEANKLTLNMVCIQSNTGFEYSLIENFGVVDISSAYLFNEGNSFDIQNSGVVNFNKGNSYLQKGILGDNGTVNVKGGNVTFSSYGLLHQENLNITKGRLEINPENMQVTNVINNVKNGLVFTYDEMGENDYSTKESLSKVTLYNTNISGKGSVRIDCNVVLDSTSTISQTINIPTLIKTTLETVTTIDWEGNPVSFDTEIINPANSLTANADNILGVVNNNSALNLTGGKITKSINGKGITHILGTVKNDSKINQDIVIDKGSLKTDAGSLKKGIEIFNNGELHLTGGNFKVGLMLKGTLCIDGVVGNQTILDEGSLFVSKDGLLVTNASLLRYYFPYSEGNGVRTVKNEGIIQLSGGTLSNVKVISNNGTDENYDVKKGLVQVTGKVKVVNPTYNIYNKDGSATKKIYEIPPKIYQYTDITKKGNLTTSADSLKGNVINEGVLNLTGGTLEIKNVYESETVSKEEARPFAVQNTKTMNMTGVDVKADIDNFGKLTVKDCVVGAGDDERFAVSDSALIENYKTMTFTTSKTGKNVVGNIDGLAILNTDKGSLTVKGNAVFKNNKNTDSNGGVIQNLAGAKLTLSGKSDGYYYKDSGLLYEDYSFMNNSAKNGGAIYNDEATLNVSKYTFYKNVAAQEGGAIYNNGTAVINNSYFYENDANKGGAVYNSGKATINNSIFYNNNAVNGGVIYNTGNLTVKNSVIGGQKFHWYYHIMSVGAKYDTGYYEYLPNKAGNGAGIYNLASAKATITSATFSNNEATANGGGIYNNGQLVVKSADFHKNKAKNGGAIYTSGNNSKLTISKTDFCDNSATLGGALYVQSPTSISSSTFGTTSGDGNTANMGGAIYNTGDSVTTISSSEFLKNTATGANSKGGDIYNEGSMVISKSYFGGYIPRKSKGYILVRWYVPIKPIYCYPNDIVNGYEQAANVVRPIDPGFEWPPIKYEPPTDYDIWGASAMQGGAIYNTGDLTIKSSHFMYAFAQEGGAIYNDGDLNITGSVFADNWATDITKTEDNEETAEQVEEEPSDVIAMGGAIYNKKDAVISKSTFTRNKSDNFGGAIYNAEGFVSINGSKFTSNRAEVNGGAIYNCGKLYINNTTFTSNEAVGDGGALYLLNVSEDNAPVVIKNSTFSKNSAQRGGAIFVGNGTHLQIVDTSFKNNTATVAGGAIYAAAGSVVDILADKKNVVFSGNKAAGESNAIHLEDATLNLQAKSGRKITINDYISGSGDISISGKVYIANRTKLEEGSDINFIVGDGKIVVADEASLRGASLELSSKSFASFANGRSADVCLNVLDLADDSNIALDFDVKKGTSDRIKASTIVGDGTLNVAAVNMISDSKTPVTINVGKDSIVSSISAKTAESAEATYKLKSYYDENGLLRVVAYGQKAKPATVAAPVAAQIGGYLTQINSYDQAFMNMDMNMLVPRSQRETVQQETYSCEERDDISYNGKGLWNRPYATFERVNLNNGPKVSNIGYGNYFGGDADMKTLSNGWKRQFSAYVGYNGSVQDYERQSIDQNGGTVGVTEVWYKNNFFTGLTLNAGANVAQASTDLGRENMPMFMTGIASKTGYNFEFKEGKFIVQPSLLLSYSFIHTFVHDNGLGHRVSSSPLNAIQVAPGLKFIANLNNGWQPYLAVNMRWNIIDKTHFSLQDVTIPDMSIDPYVEYGLGLQRRWGERFTGFGQAMIRNGGRNGVMLSFGFKWLIGK